MVHKIANCAYSEAHAKLHHCFFWGGGCARFETRTTGKWRIQLCLDRHCWLKPIHLAPPANIRFLHSFAAMSMLSKADHPHIFAYPAETPAQKNLISKGKISMLRNANVR